MIKSPSAPSLPIPPVDLRQWVGPFTDELEFIASGRNTVHLLTTLAGLSPNEAVVDIGCGSGRVALPLLSFLSEEGRYEGFDISSRAIDWCRENITRTRASFQFQVLDAKNAAYESPAGAPAERVRFPFESGAFDLAIVTSVFTHMLPEAIENYVAETARVLANGGRMFVSLFLLDDESERSIADRRASFDFVHGLGPVRTFDAACPEEGLAIETEYFFRLLRTNGFEIAVPVRRGTWRGGAVGGEVASHLQDVLVARKRARIG